MKKAKFEDYSEDAKVLKDFQNPYVGVAEGYAVLDIKGHKLSCFVGALSKGELLKKGESAKVELVCTGKAQKLKKKIKEITAVSEEYNRYSLRGEVVLYKDPGFGVMDCGVFVFCEMRDPGLKEGDYVKAEGRLDARKVS